MTYRTADYDAARHLTCHRHRAHAGQARRGNALSQLGRPFNAQQRCHVARDAASGHPWSSICGCDTSGGGAALFWWNRRQQCALLFACICCCCRLVHQMLCAHTRLQLLCLQPHVKTLPCVHSWRVLLTTCHIVQTVPFVSSGTTWVVSAPSAVPTTTVRPTSGPIAGGTRVRLTSSALFPADTVKCAFGTANSNGTIAISGNILPGNSAQLLQLLQLTCPTPVAAIPSAQSVQLTVTLTSGTFSNSFSAPFAFYDEARVQQLETQGTLRITPPWIDISGQDNITIRGDGIFATSDTPRLRLTAAAAVPASPTPAPSALLAATGLQLNKLAQTMADLPRKLMERLRTGRYLLQGAALLSWPHPKMQYFEDCFQNVSHHTASTRLFSKSCFGCGHGQ